MYVPSESIIFSRNTAQRLNFSNADYTVCIISFVIVFFGLLGLPKTWISSVLQYNE